MSRPRSLDVNLAVVAATLAAAAGAAFYVTLIIVARPHGYSSRLAEVGLEADAAQTLLRSPGGPGAYPAKALCRGAPDAAAGALKQQLQAAASGAGVTLVAADARPGVANEAAGGLVPVAVQVEANGRYDSVVTLLGGLARSQPMLFVDSVDLKSQTSSVNLKLSGRIYCSTSARL